MTSTFIKSVVRVIILFYLAGFTTPAPIAKNVPHEFEEPDSAESTSQSECEPFASQDVDERNRNTNEEFLLQQKLLSGFRQNDVNRYNISQGGFTSDSDNVPPSCIPVQYYIDECPNDTYIFIWTVFNAKSQTGTILLKLTVFDLRVFAFELCDAYKDPVEISISLAGADSSKDCQNMKRALTDFTTLLPELSSEQPRPDVNITPTAKGYAIQWCEEEVFEKYRDNRIAIFIPFLVVVSKLLIIAFCYEIYRKLLKHQIHQKTHKWYYIYWAVQMLIFAGMIIFIWFAFKHQKNIVSRYTFIASLIFDIILGIVVLIVLLSQKGCSKCCNRFRKEESGDATTSEDDTFLVPPPLSLLCHWQEPELIHEHRRQSGGINEKTALLPKTASSKEHRCLHFCTIFTNTASLITLIASLSYMTQALPAIAISYYVNPTASLIKLGFFELAIIILVVEAAFLLYLVDKCVWLSYVHCAKKIPDEVYEDEENSDKDHTPPPPSRDPIPPLQDITAPDAINAPPGVKDLPSTPKEHLSEDKKTISDTQINLDSGSDNVELNHSAIPPPKSNVSLASTSDTSKVNTPPVDANVVVISPAESPRPSISSKKDSSTSLPPEDSATVGSKPDPQNKPTNLPTKATQQPKMKRTIKYIEEYLVDGTKPELISFGHWKCSIKCCHWLFFTSAFQIIMAMLLIGISAPLLYFIMNIIIDQTSTSNDQFKDILAIIPTIALNTWLLIRYGNISHTIKDILGKATKSAMEHHESHHHHHNTMGN